MSFCLSDTAMNYDSESLLLSLPIRGLEMPMKGSIELHTMQCAVQMILTDSHLSL